MNSSPNSSNNFLNPIDKFNHLSLYLQQLLFQTDETIFQFFGSLESGGKVLETLSEFLLKRFSRRGGGDKGKSLADFRFNFVKSFSSESRGQFGEKTL